MAYAEMEPEQFIASADAWLGHWMTEELGRLKCPLCETALTGEQLHITSDRSWNATTRGFHWLHLIHVTCLSCAHVSRFDGSAVAFQVASRIRARERARPTEPAPSSR